MGFKLRSLGFATLIHNFFYCVPHTPEVLLVPRPICSLLIYLKRNITKLTSHLFSLRSNPPNARSYVVVFPQVSIHTPFPVGLGTLAASAAGTKKCMVLLIFAQSRV